VDALVRLLEYGDEEVALDLAALEVARIEYPDLDPEPFLSVLDSHARELGAKVKPDAGGPDFVAGLNRYLFADLGFRGNIDDYYDARNSCLNEVLTSRTGIPITLSVIYIEISRRLGRPVWGVGLPGHFIVRYQDGLWGAYLDPFHEGRVVSESECFDLARQATGEEIEAGAATLAPVTKRQIVVRMLNNLRGIYVSKEAYPKAITTLDLLMTANPDAADDYRLRATLEIATGRYRDAVHDLQKYLQLTPGAPDRDAVREDISKLRDWLSRLN